MSDFSAETLQRFPFVPRGRPPLTVERAEGAYLITPEGNRILDAAGGAVVVNVGHGRREVAAAVAQALEQESYVVPVFATPSRLRLLERLHDSWLPKGLTRVVLTSGGSESVDLAMRLARQHHVSAGRSGRWKIIARDLSYHGATLSTLAVGGSLKRRRDYEPMLLEQPKTLACYCTRCPLGLHPRSCKVACAEDLERTIEREGADTIAAFIAEPIVGSTGGALVPPKAYWPRIAEICRHHGILLIADEVMTGFGRTGRNFCVEHWDVTPDILVGGKGLAGGYAPLGIVVATEAVLEPIARKGDEVMFYTFGGHPSACAAADTVLRILEEEDLVRRAAETGERLKKRLARLEEHPNVAEVRGLGLLLGVELVREKESLEPFPGDTNLVGRVVGAGLKRGVFFYPGGTDPARHVIVLGPPFIIDDDDVEKIARVLEESIDETVAKL